MLHLFNKQDIDYILSYITQESPIDLDEYVKNIKQILLNSINNLSKDKMIYKIDFFLSSKIFPSIDKSIYINPINIINKEKITVELLNIFFRTILLDAIFEYYLNKTVDIKYYQKYDNLKLENGEDIMNIYKIINYLEDDIDRFYRNIYLPFYVNIINKLDNHADYIFPIIVDNNVLLSGVINDKIGGAETDLIKYKLEEMYSEPYIKNLYTKSEIEQLENILNNEKLNRLIKQKKIKLSKNFQNILKNVVSKEKNLNAKDLEDYVKKIFIVQDNENNINTDKIYNVLKTHNDSTKFLEYFIDKIVYNENLNNNNKDMVSMIDNIFDKILSHDYNHNSLNLDNEDIKFILMLETLNTLKSNNLQLPSTSNITLNVYKDINKAKVNNDEIQIDY